jgi:glutamate-1-semialdehyde 2,1-aminomutase
MSAGLAQLELLEEQKPWDELERKSEKLEKGFRETLDHLGLDLTLNRVGSMMTLFFRSPEVKNMSDAGTSDKQRHAAYFRAMLERGQYLAPSQFEALFVSQAHEDADLEMTIEAARESLKAAFK